MADAERTKIISNVYYNTKTGFQSNAKTHAEAKKIDPSITREQVKKWMDGIEYRQLKARRTDNSWIASGPRETFQIDHADFGFVQGRPHRYALMAIDAFSKKTSSTTENEGCN